MATDCNKKIRLFIASPLIYPPRGGAELRFWRYLPGLQQKNIQITIVSGTPKAKKITTADRQSAWYKYKPGETIPVGFINGFKVHQIRLTDNSRWQRTSLFFRALVTLCQNSSNRPDVIQLLTPLPYESLPWLIRLKHLGVSLVYSITLAPQQTSGVLEWLKKQTLTRLLYAQLDGLIVSSDVILRIAAQMISQDRLIKIANGVDLQKFRPITATAKMQLKKSMGFELKDEIILNVGAIHPRKRPELLLEAWKTIARHRPKAILLLVGPRHDLNNPSLKSYSKQLRGLIENSGAADRIHLTGAVKNIENYYNIADIFAFTSQKEGMPNAVLEAMASGLPVILTPFIGLSRDFGQKDVHYLIAKPEAHFLAQQIVALLDDKQKAGRLAESARELTERTLDLDVIIDRYATLYHLLAKQQNTPTNLAAAFNEISSHVTSHKTAAL